jgi:hypothetical protein
VSERLYQLDPPVDCGEFVITAWSSDDSICEIRWKHKKWWVGKGARRRKVSSERVCEGLQDYSRAFSAVQHDPDAEALKDLPKHELLNLIFRGLKAAGVFKQDCFPIRVKRKPDTDISVCEFKDGHICEVDGETFGRVMSMAQTLYLQGHDWRDTSAYLVHSPYVVNAALYLFFDYCNWKHSMTPEEFFEEFKDGYRGD